MVEREEELKRRCWNVLLCGCSPALSWSTFIHFWLKNKEGLAKIRKKKGVEGIYNVQYKQVREQEVGSVEL